MIKRIVSILFSFILSVSLFGESPTFTGYLEGRYFVLINKEHHTYQSLWSRAVIDMNAEINQNAKLSVRVKGEEFKGFLNRLSLIGNPENSISFDRFYFDIRRKNLKLRMGKQVVSWSFGYIFKPMDIFMPISVYEPTFDFSGINSVRVTMSTGPFSQFDAIVVPEEIYKNSKYAIRFITNMAEADLVFNFNHYKIGDFLGFAFKRDIGIGLWVESIYYINSDIERYKNKFNTLIGFDYTFPFGNGLYFITEYNHDETGFLPNSYDFNKALNEERKFLGKNYIFSMFSYPLNNKLSFSMFYVSNLDDNSLILSPAFIYNPGINIAVNFGAYLNLSKDGNEFSPEILDASYRGAHYLYLYIKTYF